MAYLIGYHGKDNQWSYWTTKHGFARKDLKNVSMFKNRKGAAKVLASALDKYPSQFGKFHMVERLYLVDQNNPNNNMKWSDYLESLKPKPVFELAAISADKKYMWYKRSDDKWNSDANDSALSRYKNLTDAKEVMNQIVVETLPSLVEYVGVWNVNKKDWASDLTKVKLDEADDHDDDELSEAIDYKEMTDKSESIVDGLDLIDALTQSAEPVEEPLTDKSESIVDGPDLIDVLTHSAEPVEEQSTDTDSLNEFPVNVKVKSLLDSLGFNIYDVLRSIKIISRLSQLSEQLDKVVHMLDVQDTQDLLHIIELYDLNDFSKLKVIDALREVRRDRRKAKDLAGFAEALRQSVDFEKLSNVLNDESLTDIDNRAYRFRRDEIGQWADESLDELVIDHGVSDEELMGDDDNK